MATTPSPEMLTLLLNKNPGLKDLDGKPVTSGSQSLASGTKIDVSPLLELFDQTVRANVVKDAPKFNAAFSSRDDGLNNAPHTEATLNLYFTPGNTRPSDCAFAITLIFEKALMDSLRPGEYFNPKTGNGLFKLKDDGPFIKQDPTTGEAIMPIIPVAVNLPETPAWRSNADGTALGRD
ncbi:MAG: hypothetical protein FWD61_12415 [Phycisphaerales bacterium]|nr:hypothetical protein [Phycisphaerales bacterium]